MKQEFVPYDRALKLKQLGFDETCVGYYSLKGKLTETKVFRQDHYTNQSALAPLLQQAFRWFREKYNQHSFIELVFEDEIRFDYVLYVNEDEADCIDYGDGPFETYEDAELALLDKLIEIC
jgi:hypothetical protein